jgi:SNF2 family DNA or RNA helicase
MTAMQETLATEPGSLFHTPWSGLLEFQAEGVTQCYYGTSADAQTDGGIFLLFDTGLGKSVSSIALACLLVEDAEIDRVIVACEKGKLTDWVEDFGRFSDLSVCKYHGPNRDAKVARYQPQVVVSTYETLGAGLMSWQKNEGKRGRGSRVDGPLMQGWNLRESRTLWIFDEVAKLRGRSSNIHKSFDYALTHTRKVTHQRVVGLTATPVERDFEDFYNLGRIVVPSLMPTVAEFERRFTRGVDMLGRYVFRNDRGPEFASLFTSVIVRKRKTDPDVIGQFPKLTEETITVDMLPEHRKLCSAVEDLFADDPDNPVAFTILRMTAGHPCSHLHAANPVSQTIVETLGEEFLRSVPASKSVELIKRLTPLIKGQGAQVIVFSFYGQSVLPELAKDLQGAGFSVSTYRGGMTTAAQDKAKEDFTSGVTEIFLASDAGAQGLNLGNASYVIEYDSALSYAKRLQRYNRASRLSSTVSSLTAWTMVCQESIEIPILEGVLRKNKDLDVAVGDQADETQFVSADERRAMVASLLRRAKR